MKTSRTIQFFSFLLLIAVTGCSSADPLLCFGIHRNRSHFKLIEDPRLAPYFAPDFIWDIRIFKDYEEFLNMTSALCKQNPNAILGSYASACLTMPSKQDTYPPAKLPYEQCKAEWLLITADGKTVGYPGHEDRLFLDMRKKEVRQAIIRLSVARALFHKLDAVCYDNCYWGTPPFVKFPVSTAEWTEAYMNFFQEAGEAARQAKLKCVVNVATMADKIPTAFRAIAPFVDGLMSEMAFHPKMRSDELLKRELEGYRDVLKQGKMVLLIPRYREDEKFALTQIQSLAETYGKIFVTAAGPVHVEPLYHLRRPTIPKDQ